ncbi:MAG: ABC transporter substrate-binding protein, partial [Candidatus Krumholzibacteria bacterium]|nr:ABC transporter substrate-binding protein [Candidatus Krumholzibacteria bacterium]
MRVVSLVPSLTELLFDLGLREEEVVGRTRFCVHPAGRVENVPVVGGTKSINVAEVLALQPDLVIAGREENPKEAIEKIEDAESPPRVFV